MSPRGVITLIIMLSACLGQTVRALALLSGPDVICGDIWGSAINWGKSGDITGYSVGSIACNAGSAQVSWVATNNHHPVQGTQLYRLMDGRFEQIGLCWAMHEYLALAYDDCNLGCIPPDPYTGLTLGVHCSNPDNANINGKQTRLGPRGHINAYTGYFPYPFTQVPYPPPGYYEITTGRRLQVHDADLDPALNPSAAYYVEVQYIAADDIAAGNGINNVSYRRATVSNPSSGVYNLTLADTTIQQTPALHAWKTNDNSVTETVIQIPNDGRFVLAAKATDLGSGTWHYEYALYNMNSDRSGRSFFVPLPSSATPANADFHDVDYHNGDSDPNAPGQIRGTDWTVTRPVGGLMWQTDQWTADDPQANALRWGTVYNFRFDADQPPTTGAIVLGLYKPGTPTEIAANTVIPQQPLGACCLDSVTCVADTTVAACVQLNGNWSGAGTTCSPSICTQPAPTGACCWWGIPGTCTVASEQTCFNGNGHYKGDGTTCVPDPCLGACCLPNQTCTPDVTSSQCLGLNGTWKGVDTLCEETNCIDPLVPAVSDWGNAALAMLLLIAGAALFRRWAPQETTR